MKKFNWSVVLGCLIISIGIVVAGFSISRVIETKVFDSAVPGSFDIYNSDVASYGDFLEEHEAVMYLRMNEETFGELLQSGKLDGTFAKVNATKVDGDEVVAFGHQYIFSKAKLNEYMNGLIEAGN